MELIRAVPRIAHHDPLASLCRDASDKLAADRRFTTIHRLNPPPKKPMPLVDNHMELVALGVPARCPSRDCLGITGAVGDRIRLAVGEQEPMLGQGSLDTLDDPADIFNQIWITHPSAHGRLIGELSSAGLDRPVGSFARP